MYSTDSTICVVGLGYVGLTLSVALASAGFRVHGVERDPQILDCINRGKAHFAEAGLNDEVGARVADGSFTCGTTIPYPNQFTIFVITVGTPINSDKTVDLSSIELVAGTIAERMNDGVLVVMRSTVKPGTCCSVVKPILDATNKSFSLAFCPERTLEGHALNELRTLPQIIGGFDFESENRAASLFSALGAPAVRVTSIEVAEFVKLASNVWRDYTFAFSNEMASICESVGISVIEVIEAANRDYPRSFIPRPGPVGGPCLEKDTYILADGLAPLGQVPTLPLMARKTNSELPVVASRNVVRRWRCQNKTHRHSPNVGILGFAFKGRPETSDTRGSFAPSIIEAIRSEFDTANFLGWDAIVSSYAISEMGATPAPSLEALARNSDIIFIQNNHERFAGLNLSELATWMNPDAIIYDFWCQNGPARRVGVNNVSYYGFGMPEVLSDGGSS